MLTDYWAIAQLLAQTCTLILLLGASIVSVRMLRYWRAEATDAFQLSLERQSYLVDVVVRLALVFQLLALLLFVYTANQHLPDLIEGAMCATGTLNLNPHGYPVLYLKTLGVFVYLLFLFTHRLDSGEATAPLTPFKYIFIFPAFGLMLWDFTELIQFFAQIDPDVITTCCSVSDLVRPQNKSADLLASGEYTSYATLAFINLFFLLLYSLIFGKRRYGWLFLASLGYVAAGIYALKFYFVKYIYGLPSHNCLFDLFFAQYHSIGIPIFGSFLALTALTFYLAVLHFFKPLLKSDYGQSIKRVKVWSVLFLLLSFLIPVLYRAFWVGTL